MASAYGQRNWLEPSWDDDQVGTLSSLERRQRKAAEKQDVLAFYSSLGFLFFIITGLLLWSEIYACATAPARALTGAFLLELWKSGGIAYAQLRSLYTHVGHLAWTIAAVVYGPDFPKRGVTVTAVVAKLLEKGLYYLAFFLSGMLLYSTLPRVAHAPFRVATFSTVAAGVLFGAPPLYALVTSHLCRTCGPEPVVLLALLFGAVMCWASLHMTSSICGMLAAGASPHSSARHRQAAARRAGAAAAPAALAGPAAAAAAAAASAVGGGSGGFKRGSVGAQQPGSSRTSSSGRGSGSSGTAGAASGCDGGGPLPAGRARSFSSMSGTSISGGVLGQCFLGVFGAAGGDAIGVQASARSLSGIAAAGTAAAAGSGGGSSSNTLDPSSAAYPYTRPGTPGGGMAAAAAGQSLGSQLPLSSTMDSLGGSAAAVSGLVRSGSSGVSLPPGAYGGGGNAPAGAAAAAAATTKGHTNTNSKQQQQRQPCPGGTGGTGEGLGASGKASKQSSAVPSTPPTSSTSGVGGVGAGSGSSSSKQGAKSADPSVTSAAAAAAAAPVFKKKSGGATTAPAVVAAAPSGTSRYPSTSAPASASAAAAAAAAAKPRNPDAGGVKAGAATAATTCSSAAGGKPAGASSAAAASGGGGLFARLTATVTSAASVAPVLSGRAGKKPATAAATTAAAAAAAAAAVRKPPPPPPPPPQQPPPHYIIVPPPPPPPPRKSPPPPPPPPAAAATAAAMEPPSLPAATTTTAASGAPASASAPASAHAGQQPVRNAWLNPNPVIKQATGVAKGPKGAAANARPTTPATAPGSRGGSSGGAPAASSSPPLHHPPPPPPPPPRGSPAGISAGSLTSADPPILTPRSSGAATASPVFADPVASPPPLSGAAAVGDPFGAFLPPPLPLHQQHQPPQQHASQFPISGGVGSEHVVTVVAGSNAGLMGPLIAHKHASGDLDISSVAANYRPYNCTSSATVTAFTADPDSESFSFFSTPPPVISDAGPDALATGTANPAAVANSVDTTDAAVHTAQMLYNAYGASAFATLPSLVGDPVWSPDVPTMFGCTAGGPGALAATRGPRVPPPGFPSHAYGGAFATGPLPGSAWTHHHPHPASAVPTAAAAAAADEVPGADSLPLPTDSGVLAALGFVDDLNTPGNSNSTPGDNNSSSGGGEDGAGSCAICWSAPRQVGFLHGKTSHLCVCRRCASQLREGVHRCPMCRQLIERIIDIF
ncbi:hypothetical protein Agub_g9627 [Astrephomene gubernaculifera]|uniref:RING-type domain-containing protein n=1 Tax=Astrephomene gubernaculifera TaxID=47775 RepID=A0AAD3DWA2_9CHLO|nr:hypothetical protein Agub_g9627 [Astrephomene gubernaculifera]